MRLYKVVAIIFYLIAGFFGYMEIAGVITGIIRGNHVAIKYYILIIALSTVFFLIGLRYHKKYRRLRKAYGELLDGKNVKRIDYMVKTQKFYRGGSY
ncbi:hypothetical protein [Clostridium felsineum]|uniref:hypothetical protein n=1 Tax=Clostridium felsineum TaxID=36839 RepID=UPI00098CEEA2|nr:hypothetical protein [Clostridium felsineum]URZ15201.1 hypothetical protein CLFE_012190 [Clostridium felsineum DSM 794]